MPTSEVEIVNSALAKVHEDPISSLTESRKAARVASQQYPLHRDGLLRLYNWRFAIRRAVLAPDLAAPPFGFAKKFLLPPDCLRVIGLFDPSDPYHQVNYTTGDIPWKVEGRHILVDDTVAKIVYIERVTDPTQFDSLFVEALSWSLAVDFALSLANSPSRADQARGEMREVIRRARLAAAIEQGVEIVEGGRSWFDPPTDPWFRGGFWS